MATLANQLHGSATHKSGFDAACPQCTKGMSKREIEHRIAVKARAEELHNKLVAVSARPLCEIDGPNGSSLNFYAVNGKVIIVQWFKGDHGYEVYAPIFDGNDVAGTLDAIGNLLGYARRP